MDIEALLDKLRSLEEEVKDLRYRMGAVEKDTARTDEKYKQIMSELGEQKQQLAEIRQMLDRLSQQPAKRWDNAVGSVISAIIASVIGYMAGHFGG